MGDCMIRNPRTGRLCELDWGHEGLHECGTEIWAPISFRLEEGGRYYCPVCGEVQRGYYSYYQKHWVVEAHCHCQSTGEYKSCPGGPIDKDLDRAP